MGIFWSSTASNRRRNQNYLHSPPPPPPYYYPPEPPALPPPPPPLYPSSHPYPAHPQNPYHVHPPQVHNSYYGAPPPPPPPYSCAYSNPTVGRFPYQGHPPYYASQSSGWPAITTPVGLPQPPTPLPPYVEHQSAKKIRNDVNVHKDTVKLEADEQNPDRHLISFVFDALFDGSITIFYFGKEESKCRFVPAPPEGYPPEQYAPVTVPFQKGLGQRFQQPSGTGIDLGFFDLDVLSKPSAAEDCFPLVITAETFLPSHSSNEHVDNPVSSTSTHMQITQSVIEKNNSNSFQVKVVRQILWIDGVRYELRDLYGIASSGPAEGFEDSDPGKECVICMTEPKDTAVLPCRHMCMCSECAKALRLQSNKCPICRQPIEALIEIKFNGDQ